MADLLKRLKISEQQYGVGMEIIHFRMHPDEVLMYALVVVVVDTSSPPPQQLHNKQVTYQNIFNRIRKII